MRRGRIDGLVGRDRDPDPPSQLGEDRSVIAGQRLLHVFQREPLHGLEPVGGGLEAPAPLASIRIRMSGPAACRTARTRSTRTSVSRSAPTLTLSVVKPAATAWRAASADGTGPRNGSVAFTPMPSPSANSTGDGVPSRSKRAASRAARRARPGRPCDSSSSPVGRRPSRTEATALPHQQREDRVRRLAVGGLEHGLPHPHPPVGVCQPEQPRLAGEPIPVAVANGRRKRTATLSARSDTTGVMSRAARTRTGRRRRTPAAPSP